ncbi:hypothetical protein vBOeSunk162_15 [Oenococcus phage vB_OeS_unk162]|nr:hypothetical protein vBOeSunk162_15 [Oenococcus phage vB_OeS_unk162]
MLKFYQADNHKYQFHNNEFELDLSFGTILNMFAFLRKTKASELGRAKGVLLFLFDRQFDFDNEKLGDEELSTDDIFSIDLEIFSKYIQAEERYVQRDFEGNLMDDEENTPQAYSFDYDSDLIYAAFMQTYRIDLVQERHSLSWSKFNALLAGLPSDTMFSKVVEIRQTDINEIKDQQEKTRMALLQKKYEIPKEFREVSKKVDGK